MHLLQTLRRKSELVLQLIMSNERLLLLVEVIELLCPLLVKMCKTYAIFKSVFYQCLIIPQFKVIYFGKILPLRNRSEECVDLLQ